MSNNVTWLDACDYVEIHKHGQGGLVSAISDAAKLFGVDYRRLLNYFCEA